MRKTVTLFLLFAASLIAHAQTGALSGYCNLGGAHAKTSGLFASNFQQGIIPHCTITVYLTGTNTLATVYSDAISTPLANPFTANASTSTNSGAWTLWAATNAGLDVFGSGGDSPNTYPAQVPLCVDCFVTSSFTPQAGVISINSTQGNFSFTGPSVNCTGTSCVFSTTTGADLQHNGVNLPSQSILNFLDATPSLPTGKQPVTFTNDGAGGLGGWVDPASISTALIMQSATPAAGTYIRVDPSGFTINNSGGQYVSVGSKTSANVRDAGCTFACPVGAGQAEVDWTFALPSYVNPSNVTAVWASATAQSYPVGNSNGSGAVGHITCHQNVTDYTLASSNGYGPFYQLQQFNTQLSGVTGSQVSSVTCAALVSNGSVVQNGLVVDVPQIYLQLADSIDTAPAANTIQVAPPLYFNQSMNLLGLSYPLDVVTDTGAANAYVVSNANINAVAGQALKFVPAHNSTSTTPTLALNGVPAQTIVGPTGGALASGDLLTTAVANVIYGPNGSWWLQNPQTASASAGFPITLGSTSIAANSTTAAVTGLSVNGVTLDATGANTLFLNKAGGYTTPAGAGTLTSINSQTGPAINLQSSGATVTITTPSPNVINLEAAGSASGVQYDASNTDYVFTGTSFWSDDTRILGAVITVTGGSCNATTCSITNSGTNNFSAGDWVIVSSMTGWPAAPAPFGNGSFNNAGYSDIVQVSATGLSSTTFQFLSPITATITGGSVENANQFSTMQFSRLPFADGHGTIHGVFGANHRCSDVDTNYTTLIHPQSPAVTGHPGYLLLNGCGNDISAGDSVATVEGHLQSIWQKAHTDGFVMVQGNMIIGSPGALVDGSNNLKLSQLNDWIEGQGQTFATLSPYCTTSCGMNWDRALDFHAAMSNVSAPNMFASNGGVGTGGAVATANLVNEALANKATSFKTQTPFAYFGWASGSLPFNDGPGYIFSGPGVTTAFVISDTTQANVALVADTRTTSGNIVGIRVPNILVSTLAASSSVCTDGNKRLTTSACAGSGISGATAGQALIAGSATTATSSKAIQGTDANLLSSGTITGTAAILCTDANGGATTAGCSASGLSLTTVGSSGAATLSGSVLNIPVYTGAGSHAWSCQPGLGDGLNAIPAGTYLQSTCKNTTGVTVTLTGLQCFTDNAGSSTMNAAGNTLGALLTGAVTCSSSFAAGTQSANVLLTSGDYIKFTFVADGTSKQSTWVVTGTY